MIFRSKKKRSNTPPARRRQGGDSSEQERSERYSPVYYRNRTITGSLSSDVHAATEAAGHLQSDRARSHSLARLRRRIMLIGLVCFLAVASIALFMWQFVGSVQIHGHNAAVSNQQRYRDTIDEYYAARPFERFRFALNVDALTQYITSKNPEVSGIVSVEPIGIVESDIVLRLRQPLVGWAINGKQYFVDAEGISFQQSYFGHPPVQIDDQTGVTPETGQAIASNRFLSYVGKLIAETSKRGYTVTEVIIPPATTRQIEVKLKDRTFTVKLSIDRGVAVQVEDMDNAIRYLTEQASSITVIDVRVENRAYYR